MLRHVPLKLWMTAWPALLPALIQAQSVVINEIHYDEADKTVPSEFIEIHNPAPGAMDLGNWTFSDGIEYTFPLGTTLAGGGYLVVAEDPPTIASRFGTGALGPWTGNLRNSGETVVLRNASGEKVDEVDYRLGFPWPTVGGPPSYSIELYHPDLDNELGGSWRGSDGSYTAPPPGTYVSAGSSWNYFKGTQEPPANWRTSGFDASAWTLGTGTIGYGEEFITTSLPDMRGTYSTVYFRKTFTVDDPAGVPLLELGVQFDDGVNVWINGSLVAHSPNTSGNEAHDATVGQIGESYSYDGFTILNPGAVLVPGTNVIAAQVINTSLGGSSDCFFDARLTEGEVTQSGTGPTPGARNSVFTTNAPPQLRQVDHQPRQPRSGEDVTVTVKVTDPDGVTAVQLAYQLVEPGDYFCRWLKDSQIDPRYEDPAEWTEVPMNDAGTDGDIQAGDARYTAVLPGLLQTRRRLVRYRIVATDGLGESVQAPYLDDDQPNFAYFVYDAVPAWTGAARPNRPEITLDSDQMSSIATYHLLSTSSWVDDSQFGGYSGSEYRWPGTLVYDGEVYDHIRYRPRGGVHRFQYGKNFWKFDFHRGRYFQPRDNYGRSYSTRWHKLNFSSIVQQVGFGHRGEQGLFERVGFRLFELTGVEACKTHYVNFRVIDQADEFGANQYEGDYYGLFLAIEQLDGRFLDEHDLPDGNLYKIDGHNGVSNNQGPTQVTDRSDVSSFISAYRNGNPTPTWWRDNLELEKYFSYRTIVEGIHHYDIAYGKNYFYYHRPDTGRFQIVPWDLDLTWANNMYGNGEHDFNIKVANNSAFNRDYQNRMREIRDLLYNPEQAGMLIDELVQSVYTPGVPNTLVEADRRLWDNNPRINERDRYYDISSTGDFGGMVQILKDYVVSRGAWMDAAILNDNPSVPNTPAATYTGLPGFPLNGLLFQGSAFSSPVGAGFDALEWRIAEVTDLSAPDFDPTRPRRYEIEADWQSGELSVLLDPVTIPAFAVRPGHTYRVRVRHRDTSGRWSHWSAPLQFVAAEPDQSTELINHLRISEIMYHPPEEDPEFVELYNTSPTTTLDLNGVAFTKGIDYVFPSGVILPPQAVLLVVDAAGMADVEAFRARYGVDPSVPIVGPFDGSLKNGGEEIRLKTALGGTEILAVRYGDAGDWPIRADGGGSSLELIDPMGPPDHPYNWRASHHLLGSPGWLPPSVSESVVINEVLAHTDAPWIDTVELYNPAAQSVDIGGWYLSDTTQYRKYRFPSNTVITAQGYLVVDETDFNPNGDWNTDPGKGPVDTNLHFGLSGAYGDEVHLVEADAADVPVGYADSVQFGATPNGEALGRWPNGTGRLYPMRQRSLGGPNLDPRVGPVVISEIMYHPADTNTPTLLEFVEICNTGPFTENLAHWSLDGGVSFDFPVGTILPGGQALVVVDFDPVVDAASLAIFQGVYGLITPLGPWSGELHNAGERITLRRADAPPTHDPGFYPQMEEERVHYDDEAPWPVEADGTGPSLQRLNPYTFADHAANWIAWPPSPGIHSASLHRDIWNQAHFSSAELGDPSISGDDADPDGDGLSNRDEYHADTDPRSAASALLLRLLPGSADQPVLAMDTSTERYYTLEIQTPDGGDGWDAAAPERRGNGGMMEWPAPVDTNQDAYRVNVLFRPIGDLAQ